GPGIVTDIVDELQLNQAVVSKQLGILKNYGIIKCCPSGRCREYCISDPEMMRTLLDSMNKMAEICEKTAKLQNREINGGKNA
ncbi:MAG TPA: ArsR family transcriptional regulator, partial [bacterium]|nr:ArsR family transcriptional regulator [bacterium]